MSRAGQAGEVGSVFRCAAATHFAVHGVRSHPIAGLELPAGVDPVKIDFETSDPTDDIRITFSDGRRAFISAKRKVSRSKPLRETVAGWVAQAPTLGPDDLLVLAGEEFVGPTKNLHRVLKRHRADLPMETTAEHEAMDVITALLPDDVRAVVLERARIVHVPDSTSSEEGRSLLAALMDMCVGASNGHVAASVLSDAFHTQSGQALGSTVDEWVAKLTDAGLTVFEDPDGPVGMRVAARLSAVSAYRDFLAAQAGRIDLSLLAEDLPPVTVEGLLDGLEIDLDGSRTSTDLLRTLRRWRRMLIIGQPGSGKSVALREIAAHCVTKPHAPIPIRVMLPRLEKQQPDQLTLAGIVEQAAGDAVVQAHRAPLVEHLLGEVAAGRAIILCDGLDECGPRAPWVAQQLTDVLTAVPARTGFVLATRASARVPAARLGLPRVELAQPRDLAQTVDAILQACAEARVSADERGAWLTRRREWIADAKDQQEHLLSVPLLAVLVALICANASESALPKGRATLLHDAVRESVERWEQTRSSADDSRPWSPTLTTAMLLEGFIVLGRILDSGAAPTRSDALQSLAAALRHPDTWGMPPAQATEVAEQILRFWDEHVAVFVINAADELTTRSKVFAEIATAMWAAKSDRAALAAWLADVCQYTDSDGAISLAAGLDPRIVDELLTIAEGGNSGAVLIVTDLVDSRIVTLSEHQLERLLHQLTNEVTASHDLERTVKREPRNPSEFGSFFTVESQHRGPWQFVQAACQLPLPAEARSQRAELIAQAHLDEAAASVAAALFSLTDATTDGRALTDNDTEAVVRVLSMPPPSEGKMVQESRRRMALVGGGSLKPGVTDVAIGAAARLSELPPDSAEQLFLIANHSTHGRAERIFDLLAEAGVDTSRRWGDFRERMSNWLANRHDGEAILLADIAALTEATRNEREDAHWSLSDLGDLLSALKYSSASVLDFDAAFSDDSQTTRRGVVDAVADAYGIDRTSAAQQARHVLDQHGTKGAFQDIPDEWFVATTTPIVRPTLRDDLDDILSTDHVAALVAGLDATSGWIAHAAGVVLVNMSLTAEIRQDLFERDMTSWHLSRASLVYTIAILTAGDDPSSLLSTAAESPSADYRCAAVRAISMAPYIDPDGKVIDKLRQDPDLTVRPKGFEKALPEPTYWTCGHCRSVNDLDIEDCPGCVRGVRPDR